MWESQTGPGRIPRAEAELKEINFWRPSSGGTVQRIGLGDLPLFKARYPRNRIVVGAVFSGFTQFLLSEAGAAFREGNGRSSVDEPIRTV